MLTLGLNIETPDVLRTASATREEAGRGVAYATPTGQRPHAAGPSRWYACAEDGDAQDDKHYSGFVNHPRHCLCLLHCPPQGHKLAHCFMGYKYIDSKVSHAHLLSLKLFSRAWTGTGKAIVIGFRTQMRLTTTSVRPIRPQLSICCWCRRLRKLKFAPCRERWYG